MTADFRLNASKVRFIAEAAGFYHRQGMLGADMSLAMNHTHHFTHFAWGGKACAA